MKKDTAKEIWDAMKQRYEGSTKVKRAQLQALRQEYEMLRMKDRETVNEFVARTLVVVNNMKAQGENMEQITVVEKILRSMSARFEYVVCSIIESNNVTTMTVEELLSSLLVHEARMKGHNKEEEQALKATVGGRTGGRGRGRGHGRGRGRTGSKESIECYKCHKLGHYQYECPTWEDSTGANYTEFDEEEAILLMAVKDREVDQGMWFLDSGCSSHITETDKEGATLLMAVKDQETDQGLWFLDSGCSNHMCGTRDWFSSFDDSFRESVKLVNDTRMAVKGKGSVKLKIEGIV